LGSNNAFFFFLSLKASKAKKVPVKNVQLNFPKKVNFETYFKLEDRLKSLTTIVARWPVVTTIRFWKRILS